MISSNRHHFGNDLLLGTIEGGNKLTWTEKQRRTHMYVSGVTRSGKSRFVQSLIQQDIEKNWRHKQGLLLLDPHAELYDGVLAFLANQPKLWRRPVILIDLRKDDWIVAYNLLKTRPGIDPSVVATSFVESITHAFGGANPTETPRLARIARMFIHALFDAKRTLFDVLPLLEHGNSALRDALLAELPESSARALLEHVNQLSKRDFDTTVESFINRMSSFLSNRVIGHMVGQSSALSFDFNSAIEDGAIVLVCLATAGGKVAESDSKLFASLMLSDLWQVAKLRGKKGAGYAKPFAVYADEFQNFLTYTMSQQLDQASGFGLQFILANQFPAQILDNGGDFGRAIYNSVMANALTKVAFRAPRQQDHRASLVAEIFDGAIDVHRIQHNITSFQTVGYREVHRVLKGGSNAQGYGTSVGTSATTATSTASTTAEGGVDGVGEAIGETSSVGHTHGVGHVSSFSQSDSFATGTSTPEITGLDGAMPCTTTSQISGGGNSVGEADIETDSDSTSESTSTARNSFRAKNWSTTQQVGTSKSSGASEAKNWSSTHTDSWQQQVSLEPIIEERHTQLMSVESQQFEFGQRLAALPSQHAYVALPGQRLPTAYRALECPEPSISPHFVERIRMRFIARTNCALTFSDAAARISAARAPALPDTDSQLRKAATTRRRTRATVKGHGDE